MIDAQTKQTVLDLLASAEERLRYQSEQTLMSGFQLEGAQILKQAEEMLVNILALDPVAYVELQGQLDAVWANYVRASNLSGLGDVAERLGRNK